ncbi:MAG: hypothetical protein RR900_05480, partial [Ruthenibacterium sp.]
MKHFKRNASLIAAVLFILYAVVQQMNLNPLYPDSAFFYCIIITVYVLIFTMDKLGRFLMVSLPTGQQSVTFQKNADMKKWPLMIVGGVWALFFIVNIGSSVLFHVNAYRDQMPELVEKEFASDFDTVDLSQLPIVDAAMARKLADKKLGERPSLGSQVVLGEPTLQQVDGKLVWAVPTYHSGFFKWLTNMEGTPGY